MRYFLISGMLIDGKNISHTFTITNETFPNKAFIKAKFLENYYENSKIKAMYGVSITNIFEFKDEKDYNDYQGIENKPLEKEMD